MVRRSGYDNQFNKSNLMKNYYSNVNYRQSRREQEQSHTPISWDWDSDQDSLFTARCTPSTADSLSVECPSLFQENEDSHSDICNGIGRSIRVKHKQVQTDQLSQSDDGSIRNRLISKHVQCNLSKTSKNIEKNIGVQNARSHLKPEKVGKKIFMKSKQHKRDDGFHLTKKEDNPPFLAYGISDRELMVGHKRTHNVRASQAVYPAALRAQKRREVDICRREEEFKRQTYSDKKHSNLFMDKMARETSKWSSEYQRSFPGYSSIFYSCSLSSRGKL